MWVFTFIDDRDLINGNIRDFIFLVAQIKNPIFHIDHIAAKRSIRATCHIDLFAEQLF